MASHEATTAKRSPTGSPPPAGRSPRPPRSWCSSSASFILGGERVIELFGLGLAGAVFLDALVVRSVLVPGLMLLAGKANWWLPRSLDRVLPHLNVEGSVNHDNPRLKPERHSQPGSALQHLVEETAA